MIRLRSQRVLYDGALRAADIVLEHGRIAALLPHGSGRQALDLGSRILCPGFVDLHSDAIEKEVEPRPGATFPIDHALVELDRKLAMGGITTMFHAVAFNEEALAGLRGNETARKIVERISRCNRETLLIDNLVHARYEITSFSSLPILQAFLDQGLINLLSFMDHSPGQGQFPSLDVWKRFHRSVYELEEAQLQCLIESQQEKRIHCGDALSRLARSALEQGVILASHDDDSPEKIEYMHRLGISIAEFPLNPEAAGHARQKRMATGMGAPNVVRGRSQSGNISARELIRQGLCDFLCSDYHPGSMLQAVFVLNRELQVPLPEAFAYVTSVPAALAGLEDRGLLAPGRLADITVIEDGPVPRAVLTIKSGVPVYTCLGWYGSYEHAA